MLTDEERKEIERSYQMHTASAFIGLCLLVGSFAYFAFLAVQNIRTERSLFDLPSGPMYLALFGVCLWANSKRRLKAIAEIQKNERAHPTPEGN